MVDFIFVLESSLLGVGLAMDAFCVSLANGLQEPKMRAKRMLVIAGVFALFQTAMPMIGYLCVHTIAQRLQFFVKLVPWLALGLLLYIGISMLRDAFKKEEEEVRAERIGVKTLILQGIATSIDALSVGFTIAQDSWPVALLRSGIIGILTLAICMVGCVLGRKVGTKLSNKACILGGIILIGIGLKIFIQAAVEGQLSFWMA